MSSRAATRTPPASSTSRAFDPDFLFVDGFEDDGTASWSAVAP